MENTIALIGIAVIFVFLAVFAISIWRGHGTSTPPYRCVNARVRATSGGPTMFARIGVMRALNRKR